MEEERAYGGQEKGKGRGVAGRREGLRRTGEGKGKGSRGEGGKAYGGPERGKGRGVGGKKRGPMEEVGPGERWGQ